MRSCIRMLLIAAGSFSAGADIQPSKPTRMAVPSYTALAGYITPDGDWDQSQGVDILSDKTSLRLALMAKYYDGTVLEFDLTEVFQACDAEVCDVDLDLPPSTSVWMDLQVYASDELVLRGVENVFLAGDTTNTVDLALWPARDVYSAVGEDERLVKRITVVRKHASALLLLDFAVEVSDPVDVRSGSQLGGYVEWDMAQAGFETDQEPEDGFTVTHTMDMRAGATCAHFPFTPAPEDVTSAVPPNNCNSGTRINGKPVSYIPYQLVQDTLMVRIGYDLLGEADRILADGRWRAYFNLASGGVEQYIGFGTPLVLRP